MYDVYRRVPYCSETIVLFEDLQAFHEFLHCLSRFDFKCIPLFVESLDLSRAVEHVPVLVDLFPGLCSLDVRLDHGRPCILHHDYFPLLFDVDSCSALDLFDTLQNIQIISLAAESEVHLLGHHFPQIFLDDHGILFLEKP